MHRRNKPQRILGLVVALFVGLACFGTNVLAQSTYGSLTGQVTDSTGAAVVGAEVTFTNVETNYMQTAQTNGSGIYLFKLVSPGKYSLKISAKGFGNYVQNGIVINANQYATQNVTVTPAATGTTVSVTANAELIDTTTAELGTTVDQTSMAALPLNGRDPTSLALLAPGMVDGGKAGVAWQQGGFSFPNESVASADGGRVGSTFYMLDGVTNMDNYTGSNSPVPDPDATQQFRLISDNFGAIYGFSTGGVVSMATRSGTNLWHGNLFEFLRNGDFDAPSWQYHQQDTYRQNQYGGSLGGPVVKNKLFFFFNYQGTKVVGGPGYLQNGTTTPTLQMLQDGDFSGIVTENQVNNPGTCGNPGSQVPADKLLQCGVMNGPFTTAVKNGVYYYNQLVGGASALNPAAVAFTELGLPGHRSIATSTGSPGLPLANSPAGGTQNVAGNLNYASASLGTQSYNQETARMDYDLSKNQRLTLRSFVDEYVNPGGDIPGNVLSVLNLSNWSENFGEKMWYLNELLQHSWTVNNSTVNTASLYWTSQSAHNSTAVLGSDNKPMCWSRFIGISEPVCYMEGAGYGGATGGWTEPSDEVRQTWGFSDTLLKSIHNHNIAVGIDVMHQRAVEDTSYPADAIIGFGGGYTGQGLGDWLLGYMSSYEQGAGELSDVQAWLVEPYVNDEFRVTPGLTLTLGLRWAPDLPPVEEGGRGTAFVPGQQSVVFPAAPTGLIYPGDSGMNAGLRPAHIRNFEPRIGIAWQPRKMPNTAFHAAFGMFSAPVPYSDYNHVVDMAPFSPAFSPAAPSNSPICMTPDTSMPTTCVPNSGQSLAGYMNFQNPWSTSSFNTPNGNPFGTGPGQIPWATVNYKPPYNSLIPGPVYEQDSFGRDFHSGTSESWNVSVEQQLSEAMSVRVAYVGVESYHQSVQVDKNFAGYSYCTYYNNASCPLPTQANLNNGSLKKPVVPYPAFTGILEYDSPATADYHSLQTTFQRRFAHGLQAQSSFTWQKTMDVASSANIAAGTFGLDNPRYLRWNRGISNANIPFTWVTNFVAQSPQFHGRSLLVREALGGWELSSIATWQSGTPFSIGAGNSQAVYGELGLGGGCIQFCESDRADRVPGVPLNIRKGGRSHWTKQYFNPNAFVTRHDGTFGNSGRNLIQGPPGFNVDAAMMKNWALRERYQLELRFEFYNAFNHPIMGNPDANPGDSDPSSGSIGSNPPGYYGLGTPSNTPRIGQAALKFSF